MTADDENETTSRAGHITSVQKRNKNSRFIVAFLGRVDNDEASR
jgi:hypothetical protein